MSEPAGIQIAEKMIALRSRPESANCADCGREVYGRISRYACPACSRRLCSEFCHGVHDCLSCPECQGFGDLPDGRDCQACGGTGRKTQAA